MRQHLLKRSIFFWSTFSLSVYAQQTICPTFVYTDQHSKVSAVMDRDQEQKRHSFLGAQYSEGSYSCFYGVGFVSIEYLREDLVDKDSRKCRLYLSRKNAVGIRNTDNCLGSVEDCQLICR